MELTVTQCEITAGYNKNMTITIDLSVADLITQIGKDEILDEISEKDVIKHFGIEVAE